MNKNFKLVLAALVSFCFLFSVGFAQEIDDLNEVQTAADAINYASGLVEKYDSGELNYLQFAIKLLELENQEESFKSDLKDDLGPLVLGKGVNINYLQETEEMIMEPSGTRTMLSCAAISSNDKTDSDRADYEIKGEKVSLVAKYCTECAGRDVNGQPTKFPHLYFLRIFNYPVCNQLSFRSAEQIFSELNDDVLKYKSNLLTHKEIFEKLYFAGREFAEVVKSSDAQKGKELVDKYLKKTEAGGYFYNELSNNPQILIRFSIPTYSEGSVSTINFNSYYYSKLFE